ncbi:sensor histidine kinase [Hyalangium minutum]|uniref:histidine kinase n=1 Tax=Hyalangium minutum TaxID=394096 RepID=A0A085WLB9_9BACT|nr:ATP-binding protein [Hyalangium minutum]KFE68482.1 sensory box sensor histidine kinase [Hyalangium minutum]
MSAPPKQPPSDADPEWVHQGLQATARKGPIATTLALLAWYWGDWPVFTVVVSVTGVLLLVNLWLIDLYAQRYGRGEAEWPRMLANAAGFCVLGHSTEWSPLVWTFLLYNMLWFYGLGPRSRPRLAVYLLIVLSFSLWDGASREGVLAFGLLGAFGYLITEKRASLMNQMVRQVVEQRGQLEKAHEQLQQAHQRAIAQEKLSSLGVMAAGVAHEINNPMSFVTSNIHSLYKELGRQPSLPEPLREYMEEVLPATLEGIKRVNAIVADLRRFARGDPEAYAEYDLNAEAQTALRLAQGELSHCQVEVELGNPGLQMGRPRQIVQVVVNLLANAGHATAAGGKVRLSTHREVDGARVEIRDTGTGMTPETLRNLFQPFFTTKPPGEGTGLGLAVAHGIISAHGGRIEVVSQPGQGACFTVYLPRVPPLPNYRRPKDESITEGSQPLA